jgi:hypothetical protein
MTEQTRSANGTVTEEAARLIEAMASMARSTAGAGAGQGPSPYADGPAQDSSPGAQDASPEQDDGQGSTHGVCSSCGGERDSTPVACKLCPVCQGIAFIRSVRPETVDRLADFASALASTLRDVATQSRASGPGSGDGPPPGSQTGGGRAPVQEIHVDDEDEG